MIVTEKRTQPGRVTYFNTQVAFKTNESDYGKQANLKVSVAQVELVAQ